MMSQTAEYSLRAAVFLADQDGSPSTTAEIAEGTQIPQGYLAKVMLALSRGRVVNAQRGPNGGFTLRKPAAELTLVEVVNAVDPVRRFHECPLKLPHHGPNLCPLHRKLDDCALMVEHELAGTTVADLLNVPQRRKPLCRFPAVPGNAVRQE
jgi:Rrf2 family protein